VLFLKPSKELEPRQVAVKIKVAHYRFSSHSEPKPHLPQRYDPGIVLRISLRSSAWEQKTEFSVGVAPRSRRWVQFLGPETKRPRIHPI
jgi:hypothetical protein